jgi:hypothetical protein
MTTSCGGCGVGGDAGSVATMRFDAAAIAAALPILTASRYVQLHDGMVVVQTPYHVDLPALIRRVPDARFVRAWIPPLPDATLAALFDLHQANPLAKTRNATRPAPAWIVPLSSASRLAAILPEIERLAAAAGDDRVLIPAEDRISEMIGHLIEVNGRTLILRAFGQVFERDGREVCYAYLAQHQNAEQAMTCGEKLVKEE